MSTHSEIAALHADYWLRVDQRTDLPVVDLYVEEGHLRAGTLDLDGRPAIAEYFATRNREQVESGRRTRHLLTNLDIEPDGADQVRCRATVMVFAGTGEVPIEAGGPSTIADVEDVCVRDADGRWRFRSRRLRPVFVGPGAAGFVRS